MYFRNDDSVLTINAGGRLFFGINAVDEIFVKGNQTTIEVGTGSMTKVIEANSDGYAIIVKAFGETDWSIAKYVINLYAVRVK